MTLEDIFSKLIKIAEQGGENAQKYVVWGYATGDICNTPHPQKIYEFAERGWECAQSVITYFNATDEMGYPPNSVELIECAERGWKWAQHLVTLGYESGKFGLERNSDKFKECAEKNWFAPPRLYIETESDEFLRFQAKLLQLAKKGDTRAQYIYAWGMVSDNFSDAVNEDKCFKLMNRKWECVDALIACVCAKRHDNKALLAKAENGCEYAQKLVVYGCVNGVFGFERDIHAVAHFADAHDWNSAQIYFSKGFLENPVEDFNRRSRIIRALTFHPPSNPF